MTVHIPGGLLGVSLGARVTMVADKGDKLRVMIGRDEFEVDKVDVTNDPQLSTLLIKRAQAMQAQQDKYSSQQNAVLIKQQQQEIDYLRAHPLATATPSPSPHK